ncbi:hypothetical protein HMPREF9318_01853 [Streptococcus urinalis FB127-CNA-2]|nr:hypothetical protein HMPREF9318_01853 [Streptococcus urinalis FB127-CNA-2]VEF32773.1 amino acid ABC transporter [Streptococcus urinalis]
MDNTVLSPPITLIKKKIIDELANYFKTDKHLLLKANSQSMASYINQSFIITLICFLLSLFILLLCATYQPLTQLKQIGIKKLLGHSHLSILSDYVLSNCLLIFITSVIFDLLCLMLLEVIPQYFFMSLIWGQLALIFFYLLTGLIVYFIIQQVTISKLLKGF